MAQILVLGTYCFVFWPIDDVLLCHQLLFMALVGTQSVTVLLT